MNKSYPVRTESRLLARLPPSEFRRLLPRLQPVPLNCKQVLYKALSSIEYAYFPNSGLIAALTYMENGSTIESAIIGNDGVIGLPLFLGATISSNWVIVQLAGDALRIGAEALQEEASRNGPFRELLLRYQEAFLAQVLQDVACNGLHTVKQRCCRWLLLMSGFRES